MILKNNSLLSVPAGPDGPRLWRQCTWRRARACYVGPKCLPACRLGRSERSANPATSPMPNARSSVLVTTVRRTEVELRESLRVVRDHARNSHVRNNHARCSHCRLRACSALSRAPTIVPPLPSRHAANPRGHRGRVRAEICCALPVAHARCEGAWPAAAPRRAVRIEPMSAAAAAAAASMSIVD
jgi:hypothetical protein